MSDITFFENVLRHKSYRAAAKVDMTVKGSDAKDSLDLREYQKTGKVGCHPINAGFDTTKANVVRAERLPVPEELSLLEEKL